MGALGQDALKQRFWFCLFMAGLTAGLILRLSLAGVAKTPGTSDPAFYFTVARNIAEGRGLVVDYVLFYFNGLVPVTHYSNDYWLPLASILLSLPMLVFGKTVSSALLASLLAGMVPPFVAYLAARQYFGSVALAALTGTLAFFVPLQISTSVSTDSITFFGAFGSSAILLAILGSQTSRYFLIAALCTGLAQLTRQDGALLLLAVLAALALSKNNAGAKLFLAVLVVGIHLAVVSPLLIRNYAETHALLPSGLSKTMFLSKYEDMYSYGKEFNWQSYRAELGIKKIVLNKFYIAGVNLTQAATFLDPVLAVLALLGVFDMIRLKKREALNFLTPALVFAGLGYALYSSLWSIHGPGSFYKGMSVLAPFLSLVVIDLFARYVSRLELLAAMIVVLSAYLGYQGYRQSYPFNTFYNSVYEHYDRLKLIVVNDASSKGIPPEDIIILAREPWDINAATRLKAIMIPNNDLETIYAVADNYGAQYILLPAPRRALDAIYAGTALDPRFIFVAAVPGTVWKIFQIQTTPRSSGRRMDGSTRTII
jgi:4-amino-4-deoxy-L-arabinose transferase-like glycosyltransferase